MGAGHFVFIPGVLVIGIMIGWVLGARSAADAYAAELRRREERVSRRNAMTAAANGPQPADAPAPREGRR